MQIISWKEKTMSVKNDIRSELEAHRGEDISGQYLAEKLGVSRNAVWKAINSLKNDGYKITSSTNKGYCLSESWRYSLAKHHWKALPGENTDIKIFESLDSTNNEAKRETANGKTDKPLLIIRRSKLSVAAETDAIFTRLRVQDYIFRSSPPLKAIWRQPSV